MVTGVSDGRAGVGVHRVSSHAAGAVREDLLHHLAQVFLLQVRFRG